MKWKGGDFMNVIASYLSNNVVQLITMSLGITIVSVLFSKALKLFKEISELLQAIVVAFADKKLTKEELDIIVKEAKDVPLAVKALLKK